MAYKLHRPKGEQRLDANGVPFNGGVYTYYQAGTTTPLTVYKTEAASPTWGTSVTLDSAGRLTDAIFVGETDFKEVFTPPASSGEAAITFDGYPGAEPSVSLTSARPRTPVTLGTDASILMVESDIGTVVALNTVSHSITFTLLDPADTTNGDQVIVRKTDAANTLSIVGPIDGDTQLDLTSTNAAVTLVSNGIDEWTVVANSQPGLSGPISADMLATGVGPQVGESRMFSFETVPTLWLEEDGSAKSRTTYAALFAAIGVTHGQGDGSTTFNLPDSRGKVVRGWDHAAGVDPDTAALTVTGAANNGSGLIRLTMASTASLRTGQKVTVSGVGGVSNATGTWTITVISTTTIDLQASTWSGTFTSGGSVYRRYSQTTGGNVGDHVGTYQSDTLRSHSHTLGYTVVGGISATGGIDGYGTQTSTASTGGNETRMVNISKMICIFAGV